MRFHMHELRARRVGSLFLKLDFEKVYDWVNWEFLREVLTNKSFSQMVVHRLTQLAQGDNQRPMWTVRLAPSPGMPGGWGRVMHFHPFSLTSWLTTLQPCCLELTRCEIYKGGPATHLGVGGGGVRHTCSMPMTRCPWLSLVIRGSRISNWYCSPFENMSRLKINFHKTEVVVIGVPKDGKRRVRHAQLQAG
jgi:hypothetical protein